MSNFDHIVLFLFLFSGFILWGKYFSSTPKKVEFWIFAFIPITVYSLITGSRYGWGPDYIFYKYRLENALRYPEEQLGFKWINQTIKFLDISYVGGYIIYSFVFITCVFILIRSYNRSSIYMYYFVIPATLIFVTSAIRQGLALSFVFLGLYFLNKKKWIGVILCILVGSSIHSSILVTVVIIGAVYLFIKNPINWKISIPFYLFFTFLFNPSNFSFVSIYISKYISLGNSFQSYIDNSDVWFGKEAANDIYNQSPFALFTSSSFYISIIYLGYITLKFKTHNQIVYIYNVVVIGLIFYRIGFNFEILRRIAEPMLMLYFIVLGYTFYIIYNIKRKNFHQSLINKHKFKNQLFPYYNFFIVSILIYLILFFGRFIFLNPTANFYWNK
jgi:hypothetical protein